MMLTTMFAVYGHDPSRPDATISMTEKGERHEMSALAVNTIIARELFGYAVNSCIPAIILRSGQNEQQAELPDYTREWDAAGAVMNKLRAEGWLVELKCIPDGIPWLANGPAEPDMPIQSKWFASASFIKGRLSKGETPEEAEDIRRYVYFHPHAHENSGPRAIAVMTLAILHRRLGLM